MTIRSYKSVPMVIVASGPSLSEEQCEITRTLKAADLIHVIAVNNAYERVPNADALVAADQPWWKLHMPIIQTVCPKMPRWTCDPRGQEFGANVFHANGAIGIAEPHEPAIRRGSSSGFMAIGLAIRWGARHICLIGFDSKRGKDGRSHYFGEHPQRLPVPQPFERWAQELDSLAEPAKKLGIRIAQCSIDCADKLLPRSTLAAELLEGEKDERTDQ